MHHVLRRTATGLGGGALAVSAFALAPNAAHAAQPLAAEATAASSTAVAATTTALKYDCYTTKAGIKIGLGTWPASVTVTAPLTATVGSVVTAPSVGAAITVPSGTTSTLRLLGISSLTGSATVWYSATGAVKSPGNRTTTVTVPTVKVPSSGSFPVSLTGGPISETAASSPGTATFNIGALVSTLKTNTGKSLPIVCTPPAGQSLVVLNVAIK